MSPPNEFREFARECLGWANTARTEQERAAFMQMAETWIDAALRLEPEAVRLIDKVALEPNESPDGQQRNGQDIFFKKDGS
jgi:hypothetical protein